MTKTYKDLLKQARDALEYASAYTPSDECPCCICEALAALQEAIDAPDPEPFAWYSPSQDECMSHALRLEHKRLNTYTHRIGDYHTPLYLHP